MKLRVPGIPKFVDRIIHAMGIALVVCGLLFGVVSTPWFRHVLKQHVQASLEESTGGKVEIIGLGFHPWSLRCSAQKLIVHGLEKKSDPPLFAARNILVTINPASLIRLRLLLRTLAWQQAALHVVTYPDGSTNLPGAHPAAGGGQGLRSLMDLRIHRLILAHTVLTWNNRVIPVELTGRDVTTQLRLTHDRHYLGLFASTDTILNWNGRTLPPISSAATFRLSSNRLQVSSLSWQIAGLKGHASGAFHWEPSLAGDFSFRSNGGLQQAAKALGVGFVRKGFLFMDGNGSYGRDGLAAKGRVETRELEVTLPQFKPGVVNLAAHYALEKRVFKLTDLTFSGLQGRGQGAASVSLEKAVPFLRLDAQIEHMDLNALLRSVPAASGALALFHPQAQVNGKARADWRSSTGLRGQFDLQFLAPQEAAAGSLPVNGHAQGSVLMGRETLLSLQTASFATPHSTLEAQGSFGTAQSSLALKVVTSDFDEWRPLAGVLIETRKPLSLTLRSKAVFIGKLSGTFSQPEIEGRLEAGAFDFGGWPWDGFQANILGTPSQTRITSGRLELGSSLLTLDAQASLTQWMLQGGSRIQLKASARETPLAGLRAALNMKTSMRGLLTGQVQAEGTLLNLSATGEFAVDQGEFAGIPFDLLSAQIRASGSAWKINKLRVIEGRGTAEGQLSLDPVHHTFSAELHGSDFPLNHLHLLHPAAAGTKSASEVSGTVRFDVNGRGSFDNARVHSSVEISQLAWKGQPLGSVSGGAEWQGHQIRLRLSGGGDAGKIDLSGNIETRDQWPMQLSAQYTDFRVDPWIEQLAGHSMGAQVTASGSITASGPLRQASRITGNSQVQRLQIDFPGLQMTNQQPIQIRYAERHLTLEKFRMEGPSTDLEVGGSLGFAGPPTLDLTAKGSAAATLLSLLSPKVEAAGKVTVGVHVAGTLARPQLSGTVEIKDVNLGYGDLPFRVNALHGTIKLERTRAVISSLQGTIGGGTVSLSGYAALQDVVRYQMRTRLSQIRVRYPSDFTTLLDGNLILRGTPERGQLSGDITIRNVFARENLNLMDLLAGNNKPLANSPLGVSLPFASDVNVNVQVSSARPVQLETHDLRLVADVDTRVQGTLARPVVVGTIYLRSGQTIFRGNRYTLTRGEISMTNPFETEPVVDLQVQTHVDKYELTLEISGPLDQIRFSYRSDPPLRSEDILSLLAFGYSKSQEAFGTTTQNSFRSVGTSALLSQALSSQVTGRVQHLFGVSRVKLDPYSDQPGTLGGPVLTIEQQLSPDLTVTYQTSTANSQYRVVEFEWTVNPRMSVRGFRDQNGIFGLELKFRKRFK